MTHIQRIPNFQPFIKSNRTELVQSLIKIQVELFRKAKHGILYVDYNEFCNIIAYNLHLSDRDLEYLIQEASNQNVIQIIPKSFIPGCKENNISLKLDIISYESIFWTLKSLMIDEIKPTFRTIQNRIKEVFNYRIDPMIW